MSEVSFFSQSNSEVATLEQNYPKEVQRRWVTTLFVTFRYSNNSAVNGRDDGLLRQYHTILEQAVGPNRGDVVALSNHEALAVFTACDASHQPIQDAVASASAMLDQVRQGNLQRLAEDMTPLRLGIGLDAGRLNNSGCNRHPRLDPTLQEHIAKARRLSDLNCQTPFPTVFVSHAVASRIDSSQRYAVQNLGSIFIENHADPITVYALMDRDGLVK